MTRQESGYRGGSATFERYGARHMAAIAEGRKRLPRFSERKGLGRSLGAVRTRYELREVMRLL